MNETIEQRTEIYGPFEAGATAEGHLIRGILESYYGRALPGPIPAHVVALIYAAAKCGRAARPHKASEDHYIDGHNYLDLARSADPRFRKTNNV